MTYLVAATNCLTTIRKLIMALPVSTGSAETHPDATTIATTEKKLTTGFLNIFQPPLENVQRQLQELGTKQSSLLVQLQEENNRLADPVMTKELLEMYAEIKTYTAKLISLKKDMHQTAEKATQIKNRALRLQMAKQEEALLKESQREMQLQQEQELIAKPTSSKGLAS